MDKELFWEAFVRVYEKVDNFFEGNHEKTDLWFNTPNPGLGNIAPRHLVYLQRLEKLEKFIDDCLAGNFA